MAAINVEVHVVSKIDNERHAAFAVQEDSSHAVELPPSSIRARTVCVSLTSNNLSYARGGHFMHWWDAYPVPTTSPPPFNDTSSWGIVPAWGYAVVTESTASIPTGTVVWGYWPTSATLTDLKLKAAEPKGHWIEISDHRQKIANLYNRYTEVATPPVSLSSPKFENGEWDRMAWSSLFCGVWEGAYLLSQHVFSPNPTTQPPIHPLGTDIAWAATDADLSSAIVISLSASGKTARSFAYHLSKRPKGVGPLGLLQITSSPSPISEAADVLKSSYPTKTISYPEISRGLDWITTLNPSKLVILDFGGRGDSLEELHDAIKTYPALKSSQTMILQIGNQQKVYTKDEFLASRAAMARLGKIQYNTAGVLDTLFKAHGAGAYFESFTPLWEQWLCHDRLLSAKDMKVVWGKGIAGAEGVERGWERLSRGEVGAGEGLVYRL